MLAVLDLPSIHALPGSTVRCGGASQRVYPGDRLLAESLFIMYRGEY